LAAVLLALGALIILIGLVLFTNFAGAAEAVIHRVTSRSLGELAPGFAASRAGFSVYAVLIIGIGIATAGVGCMLQWPATLDVWISAFGLGVLIFLGASVLVIVGEVRTYRALKR
jgi:hypothetical protein